jgi:uncharacterized protein (TIGR02145 family)
MIKIDMKNPFHLCLLLMLLFLNTNCEKDDNTKIDIPVTVTDADGNIYSTITIGNQIWMQENLKTTKYNDGTPITPYSFGLDWHNANNPIAYYQWASTADLNNIYSEELPYDYYGAMYNHYAIESGKLAPPGWRIPTLADFVELKSHLASIGFQGNEATVLKIQMGWLSSSGNGTNDVAFNGKPNGYINAFGGTTLAEGIATFATSSTNLSNSTRILVQLYNQNTLLITENAIQIGSGIRCIKE